MQSSEGIGSDLDWAMHTLRRYAHVQQHATSKLTDVQGVIPGCTVDPLFVSAGQLWVLEFMFAQCLIFTAFGVGLDPRSAKSLGPALAPVLVGTSLGLGTLASAIAKPGYTGVCEYICGIRAGRLVLIVSAFNPARCLGLMTSRDIIQHHWVR